ncbi:MAG TPA: hypothetical protein VKB51_01420, partial [bacterium]|nr:hypothetical protein [bacterium]
MKIPTWIIMLLGAMALLVAGCGGGGGGSSGEPPGYIIPPGGSATISTAQEACWACHGNGGPVDVDAASTGVHVPVAQAAQLRPVITKVITNGNNVAITVHVTDDAAAGAAVTTLTSQDLRFTFAKLVAAGASGFPQWTALITNSSSVPTYERANDNTSFVNVGGGDYTYTLTNTYTGLNGDTVPHRIGVQVPDGVQNGWADFTPTGSPATFNTGNFDAYNDVTDVITGTPANDIVRTQTCNACHGDQGAASNGTGLAMHGGDRRDVQYCLTCHNPDNPNTELTNTQVTGGENLDLKTVVHKIHMGKDLPSVEAGGAYVTPGYRGPVDFSKGAFPQPVTNCEKCHQASTLATAWQNDPSIDACGTCHDRTWWGAPTATPAGFTNHGGGGPYTNGSCAGCHPASGPKNPGISIASAHPTALQFAAASGYTYNVDSVNVVTNVTGLFPAGMSGPTYRVGTTLPAVTSITNSTTTATITFASAHLMLQGATITVSGANEAPYNGTFRVTGVSGSTATYTMTSDPGGAATTSTSFSAKRKSGELQVQFHITGTNASLIGGSLPTVTGISATVGSKTAIITFSGDPTAAGLTAWTAGSPSNMSRITVEGAAQSEFNGTFSVDNVTSTTATYTMKSNATVANATLASGATAITAETGPWADHGSGSSRSSRLNMSVGWKSSGAVDYTNEGAQAQHTGSDKTPGKPLDFDLLCPWEGKPSSTCQSDYLMQSPSAGVYVLTTTLPSNATSAGTGIAMIDGHPRGTIDGAKNAAADIRIPVTTVYREFGIRDSAPATRRTGVVAQAKCNNCHGGGAAGATLSMHGNNRNISAATDVVVCTVCHNSSNSDLAMRPADATTTADDRKKEESIDFKRMIHRIHAGRDTTTGFVEIFGYGG